MEKLQATKPLRYAGKKLAAGDEFFAKTQDARLLKALNKATACVALAEDDGDPDPFSPGVGGDSDGLPNDKTGEKSGGGKRKRAPRTDGVDGDAKKKRTYKTRQLKAE